MIIKGFFPLLHVLSFVSISLTTHSSDRDAYVWRYISLRFCPEEKCLFLSSHKNICKFFFLLHHNDHLVSVYQFAFGSPHNHHHHHLTLFYCLSLLLCLWSFNHDSLKDSWTRVHFWHFFFFVLDYFCWRNCIVARWVNAFVTQKIKEPKWYRRKDWKLDTNEFIIEWKSDKQEGKIKTRFEENIF